MADTRSPELTEVERDIAGETVCGFRVAAYRETHPEHGDKFGHRYSEHWSTPSNRDPRIKVERLFTETQLREALSSKNELPASAPPVMGMEEMMRATLHKSRAWLFECWGWLLETDLDMTCPMETDPLDIVEEIDALLGIEALSTPLVTGRE